MQHLLLLHGAIGGKDQLITLAEELKTRFIIHSLNFSGHGGNNIPDSAFAIDMFARDVLEYMDEYKIESACIFGYSMGGYVAMYLAKNFPARVTKFATLATKFEWTTAIAEKETKMLDPLKIEEKIPQFAKQLQQRHHPQNWKLILHKTAEMMKAMGADNPLKQEDYAAINTPVMVLLGDRDKMVSLDETVNVYRLLPQAQFGILPATPHPLEQTDVKMLSLFLNKFFQ